MLDLDKGSGTKPLMVTGMEGHMYTEDSAGLFRLRGHTGSFWDGQIPALHILHGCKNYLPICISDILTFYAISSLKQNKLSAINEKCLHLFIQTLQLNIRKILDFSVYLCTLYSTSSVFWSLLIIITVKKSK